MLNLGNRFVYYLWASGNSIRAVGRALHREVGQTMTQVAMVGPPPVPNRVGLTLVLALIAGVSLTSVDARMKKVHAR